MLHSSVSMCRALDWGTCCIFDRGGSRLFGLDMLHPQVPNITVGHRMKMKYGMSHGMLL